MQHPIWAVVAILLAVASIQYGSTLAKQLFDDLGVPGTVMLRTGLAAMIMTAVHRPWRGERLERSAIIAVVIYGTTIAAMTFTFYLSLERIPLGVSVALQFIGPLGVAIAGSRRPLDLLWVVLAIAGIIMIIPNMLVEGRDSHDALGVFYALLAAGFWAAYIISGRRVSKCLPAGRGSALGLLMASAIVVPFGLWHKHENLMNETLWLYAPAVAVLACALPYTLELLAMARLPTKIFGVLMSLEPAIAALFGHYLLDEVLYPEQWCGIGTIVAASAGSILSSRGGLSS